MLEAKIALTDAPGPEVAKAIGEALSRLNDERLGVVERRRPLTLTITDPATGAILGGLSGWTMRGYLYVDLVFVPEALRGSGLGRDLLQRAEQEALARGCHSAWLSTYSFQAPGFYAKQGYRVFGELPDHPAGHSSVFLTKQLRPPPGASAGRSAVDEVTEARSE